jgi:nitrite reductase (NADH) small subunit
VTDALVPTDQAPTEGATDSLAWYEACAVSELIEGAALASVRGRRLMMITVGERMFAFDDFCPHAGGPMHRGEFDGLVLTCPLHGWQFDLGDQGRELHGLAPLPMYPVRVVDGSVQVFL